MSSKQALASIQNFDIENIFNSISDYVSVHDRDFRIVRVNSALCAFLGRREEELIGNLCYSVFHNRESNWPNCPQVRLCKEIRPVTELVDDEHIGMPLLVTCSPVHDENGELLGVVHIARNVTQEQQQMHEADETIAELRRTLSWLKGLDGILTICSSCKNIRNQDGDWERIEKFMTDNAGVLFSHGMCPGCFRKLFPGVSLRN
ncbi:PAS domain-containing protein [Desulfopila aestuarii]|uniref:PAS domain S-box-containing protein n=1 Tax=Desulfopila aestuarii DSM 18488 TaxID=1121416 RepID=A0A1M7YCM4_9BACT|nr:PAS domain-containing protein [Desulfopila aestuarii]SHO50402.1 PAS domain S-box-containing protein [Desulfopila aestuarii DSM 18488]